MKNLLVMTIAQFKIVTRNRLLLVASLGIAIISMLIFGFLFEDTNTRPLSIVVSDLDGSATSKQIVAALKKEPTLRVSEQERNAALDRLKRGQLAAVVVIEPDFEKALSSGNARVELYVDQSDLIGSARGRASVMGVFDAVSKQKSGYKALIRVQEQQVSVQKQRAIDVLTPGMLGLTLLYANIYVGIPLTTWRLNGTLRRLHATPLKAWQLIIAQMLSQFLLSSVQAAIILVIARVIFGVVIDPLILPQIALFVIAGSFSMMALGYAIGNFVPRPNAAQAVATLIALPMMFLGGSYFPVNVSGILWVIVEITPLTHLNRAFQQIMLNRAGWDVLLPELGILLLIGMLLLLLAVRAFRWNW